MIDRLWQRGMRTCVQRDWSCWETNRKTKKRGKDGGRKCETEGEEEAVEVKKERMGKRKRKKKKKTEKYLAFYLLLIKFITFVSQGDWERDWQGHGWEERKRRREQLEIINPLIKLLFKERWIDRDEEQGNRRADSERGRGAWVVERPGGRMCERERDVMKETWGKETSGGRREEAVGSQESRLEGKTRKGECTRIFYFSEAHLYWIKAEREGGQGEEHRWEQIERGRSYARANSVAIATV